jgi:hypothetical protein
MPEYKKVPDGKRYHPSYGRIVEHQGYATRIFWSKDMLDYLRQHYATTLNEELAGCLGVSVRTMIRKARELGLVKDREWLLSIWDERRVVAQIVSRRMGNPGAFKKGIRHNPDGEFKKGRKESDEMRARRIEKLKKWNRMNPAKLTERARKAWVTRRKRQEESNNNSKSEKQ